MTITYFDIETTIKPPENWEVGKSLLGGSASPYDPFNKLVCGSFLRDTYDRQNVPIFVDFSHQDAKTTVQKILDSTELLVGFNIKFDLGWLRNCGFVYEKDIYDCMLAEYIISGHTMLYPSLTVVAGKYGLGTKIDKVKKYWYSGINTDAIPMEVLEQYNVNDVMLTREVYQNQIVQKDLQSTVKLSNDFCNVLIDIENDGIFIDNIKLQQLKESTEKELLYLENQMKVLASDVSGDTVVNLNSPEQLSILLYSRKVKDKNTWKNIFQFEKDENKFKREAKLRYISVTNFVKIVKNNTQVVYRTESQVCDKCNGTGNTHKVKKDGTKWKNVSACKFCKNGKIYVNTDKVSGFKITPDKTFTTVNGFSTDKETIEELLKRKLKPDARQFLECLSRYNALNTYLTAFIGGVEKGIFNGVLHPSYRQVSTATGRLSSNNPNVQNMPRGSTFPIKRVFTSRWENGKILDADFAQLEFRVAVEMSGDEKGIEDIQNKVDIHSLTAAALGLSRQDAKSHTFAPLYGASNDWGLLKRYPQIGIWQNELIEKAIKDEKIILPTGRMYNFKGIKRTKNGCNFNTKVKNYPVQGYATADIVPAVLIEVHKKLKEYQSKVIATIHDSILIDVHPKELEIIPKLVKNTIDSTQEILYNRYGVRFNVPLEGDIKLGNNALDMEKIK